MIEHFRQDFIKACSTMNHETFMSIMHSTCSQEDITESYLSNFESLWSILNEHQIDGYPNGEIFLKAVAEGLDDPDDESAELFLSFFNL